MVVAVMVAKVMEELVAVAGAHSPGSHRAPTRNQTNPQLPTTHPVHEMTPTPTSIPTPTHIRPVGLGKFWLGFHFGSLILGL